MYFIHPPKIAPMKWGHRFEFCVWKHRSLLSSTGVVTYNMTNMTSNYIHWQKAGYEDWLLSYTLQWRHNGHDSVSNHQLYDCLLNRLFRRRSKKTSKLRVTGLCEGNSPVTGEFPAQRASDKEKVSIWWRHHAFGIRPISHLMDIVEMLLLLM